MNIHEYMQKIYQCDANLFFVDPESVDMKKVIGVDNFVRRWIFANRDILDIVFVDRKIKAYQDGNLICEVKDEPSSLAYQDYYIATATCDTEIYVDVPVVANIDDIRWFLPLSFNRETDEIFMNESDIVKVTVTDIGGTMDTPISIKSVDEMGQSYSAAQCLYFPTKEDAVSFCRYMNMLNITKEWDKGIETSHSENRKNIVKYPYRLKCKYALNSHLRENGRDFVLNRVIFYCKENRVTLQCKGQFYDSSAHSFFDRWDNNFVKCDSDFKLWYHTIKVISLGHSIEVPYEGTITIEKV